jgi:hypothetical protein
MGHEDADLFRLAPNRGQLRDRVDTVMNSRVK